MQYYERSTVENSLVSFNTPYGLLFVVQMKGFEWKLILLHEKWNKIIFTWFKNLLFYTGYFYISSLFICQLSLKSFFMRLMSIYFFLFLYLCVTPTGTFLNKFFRDSGLARDLQLYEHWTVYVVASVKRSFVGISYIYTAIKKSLNK